MITVLAYFYHPDLGTIRGNVIDGVPMISCNEAVKLLGFCNTDGFKEIFRKKYNAKDVIVPVSVDTNGIAKTETLLFINDVLENTLTEHTPDYYSTVQLNVTYDKKADCPLFKKFLMDSMGGDMEQVALIQEMLGYFLIPVNSAQKCFVIVGVASAGKSVLLRVLNDVLLGKQNVSNVSWQALNERFKTAELFGKLANIFADLPTKNIDDNGIFKALVGEDYLTVEKKNKNPFSFQSSARLLFSCNSIPKNYGDRSEGFYRRLIIIRFSHPSHHAYHNYGGRGITVCERWLESFENFWEDMGSTWKKGLDLDRIDNNKGYEPGNCRWTSTKINNRNRRTNRYVDSPLGRMTVSELSEKTGIGVTTLLYRLEHGWPIELLCVPPDARNKSTTSGIVVRGTDSQYGIQVQTV